MPLIFLLMTWAFVVFPTYIQRNMSIVVCLNHTFDTVRSRKADHPTFCLHSNLHYIRDAIINDHSEGHSLGDDRPSVTMNVLRSELCLISCDNCWVCLCLWHNPTPALIIPSWRLNKHEKLLIILITMYDTVRGLPRRHFFIYNKEWWDEYDVHYLCSVHVRSKASHINLQTALCLLLVHHTETQDFKSHLTQ